MDEKLREAACFGDLDAIGKLLGQGADINSQHQMNGWTALHWAAKRNNLACVKLLLNKGADKLVATSKGELPAHLTTNKSVLQELGYSGDSNKIRREKSPNPASTTTSFVPNYIRHPPLNYKVEVGNSFASTSNKQPSHEEEVPRARVVQSAQQHTDTNRGHDALNHQIRIIKVRLSGHDDYDKDFIEIDIPAEKLNFRHLIESVCNEFSIEPSSVIKVRKLPNTRLRRDIEIARLKDYEELEFETFQVE